MGKESVIYRDTREKIDKVKYEKKGESTSSFRRNNLRQGKKNISKKDSDKVRKYKEFKLNKDRRERNDEKIKNNALKKLQMGNTTLAERKAKILADVQERRKTKKGGDEDDEWQDVDEHEKEVFATTGYFDVPEVEAHISKHDQNLLEKMD